MKLAFCMDELIVQIKALLNRNLPVAQTEPEQYSVGQFNFDYPKQKLIISGKETTLSHRESELLKRLYQHWNQVQERNKVLRELCGMTIFLMAAAWMYL